MNGIVTAVKAAVPRQKGQDRVEGRASQVARRGRDESDEEARAGEDPLLHLRRIGDQPLNRFSDPRAHSRDATQCRRERLGAAGEPAPQAFVSPLELDDERPGHQDRGNHDDQDHERGHCEGAEAGATAQDAIDSRMEGPARVREDRRPCDRD